MIVHGVSVASPIWLLFQQQQVSVVQQKRCSQTADAATNNHHVVMLGGRRQAELVAISDLMADLVAFAIHPRISVIALCRKHFEVNWTTGSDGTCHHDLDEISPVRTHGCSLSIRRK